MSAIDDKARALGNWIGDPLGPEYMSQDGHVTYRAFSNGVLICLTPAGVFEVHGAIYMRYHGFGAVDGGLGAPVTDETGTPDGVGRFSHFEHGSIYWSPTTGAHETHGAIRDQWAGEGWERGPLGYPITEELQGPEYRYQYFQFGALRWTAASGVEHGCPRDALFGIADSHCHPMAHLGFGGLLWGEPSGALGQALAHCEPAHGIGGSGFDLFNLWRMAGLFGLEGAHFTGGYPEFDGWPTFFTRLHQQMHVDWIERTYRGGLRLMIAHTVHSELIANIAPRAGFALEDMAVVEAQIAGMKALVAVTPWMEIVRTPDEARTTIASDKLAVILGVEMDSLGNWSSAADCSDDDVRQLVAHLHDDLEVRVVFPVHLADSAFGGASCYSSFFALNHRVLRGQWQKFGQSWAVRYQVLKDIPEIHVEGDAADVRLPGRFSGVRLGDVAPEINNLKKSLAATPASAGHVNGQALTDRGRTLINELVARGMLIDIDHMSEATANDTLAIVEASHYPVMSGHASFRELGLDGVADWNGESDHLKHESAKSPTTLDRLRLLGSFVGVITAVGDVIDDPITNPGTVTADCPGSSATWARSYLYAVKKMNGRVAIGTDFNGMAGTCSPRFGPQLARSISSEPARRDVVRDSQHSGVRYNGALADYRRNRFELGNEAYSYAEREIWEAIAFALSDTPIDSFDSSYGGAATLEIIDIAKGLRAESEADTADPENVNINFLGNYNFGVVQRGAFYAKTGRDPATIANGDVRAIYERVRPVWERFESMNGPNRPLDRAQGGRHDWDYNIDGFCHYGLLPDFLSDLGNIGLRWDIELIPLLRSPESVVQTWERCTTPDLRAGSVAPFRVDPPTLPRPRIQLPDPSQFPIHIPPPEVHIPRP